MLLFCLLLVVVSILDNLSLFLDISAFLVILNNRLHFFNNNTKIIISIRNIETIILRVVIIVLERLIIKRIDISYFIL